MELMNNRKKVRADDEANNPEYETWELLVQKNMNDVHRKLGKKIIYVQVF